LEYEGLDTKNYSNKEISENLLLTNLNIINNENKLKNFNNGMKIYQKEGDCFGDWEMISCNSKTTFAFASEESDLFVLDKDYFIDYFSKPIIKSANERKLFIKKIIQPLTNFGFDDFYNKISPIVNSKLIFFILYIN